MAYSAERRMCNSTIIYAHAHAREYKRIMNDKAALLNRIIELVLDSTAYERPNGTMSVTREDVLSSERKGDNVGMIRCILCYCLLLVGFTKETMADLLGRKVDTINDMLMRDNVYKDTNFVYRVARKEAEGKCKSLMRDESRVN